MTTWWFCVISYCYYQMICRWWSMKVQWGKNHPVRKKYCNFWKVCLTLSFPPSFFSLSFSSFLLFSYLISLEILSTWIADYSGGHAAMVGSVLVTNLKSGFRKGEWDCVQVPLLCETLCDYWVSPARNTLQYMWSTLSNLLQIHSWPQKFWY